MTSLRPLSSWALLAAEGISNIRKIWVSLHTARLLDASAFVSPVISCVLSALSEHSDILLPYIADDRFREIGSRSLDSLRFEVQGKAELRTLLDSDQDGWTSLAAKFITGVRYYAELCFRGRDLFLDFIKRFCISDTAIVDEVAFSDTVKHVFALPSFPVSIIRALSTLDFKRLKPTLAMSLCKAISSRLQIVLDSQDEVSFHCLESFCVSFFRDRCFLDTEANSVFSNGIAIVANETSLVPAAFNTLLNVLCLTCSEGAVTNMVTSSSELSIVIHRLLNFYNSETSQKGKLFSLVLLIYLLIKVDESFEVADCVEALFFCVQELSYHLAVDPWKGVHITSFLQSRIDDYLGDVRRSTSDSLNLKKCCSRQLDQFARSTALIYSDLYGIPLLRLHNSTPYFTEIPDEQLTAMYRFVCFLSQSTDCPISEIRESFKALFSLEALSYPAFPPAGVLLDAYLFNGEYDAATVAETISTNAMQTLDDHPLNSLYSTFYHEYAQLLPSTASGQMNCKDCKDTVQGLEISTLPKIRLLVLDIMFNPLRLSSWTSLYYCIRDVQEQAADKVAEHSLSDSISIDSTPTQLRPLLGLLTTADDIHDLDNLYRDAVLSSRCTYIRKETPYFTKLLQIREYATAMCTRMYDVYLELFKRLRQSAKLQDDDIDSALELFEAHAFLLYCTASTRWRSSLQQRMYLSRAYSR